MMVHLKLVWGLFITVCVMTTPTEATVAEQEILAQADPNGNIGVYRFSPQNQKHECKEHRVGAHETVTGDVHFGPRKHNEHPTLGKLSGINSSSWEQWVFDSVSDNGSSGIFLSLGRDASYSFFGQGNLHVEFYALLEDGTKIQELAFVDESSVYDCGDFVASTWASETHSFEFRVPRDMDVGAETTFTVSTPKVRGRFVLTGTAPGHFPDGTLHTSPLISSTQVAPGLHMHDTVPAAQVRGELMLKGRRNEHVLFSGVGGHFHLWAIDNWFKIIWGFRIIRGSAGPYSFFYWEPTSRFGGMVPHYTAILFKDGEKLVSTQANAPSDEPEEGDYVRAGSTHHGRGARALVAGRSTGHVIEFWSDGKRWRFELEHQHVQVQMPFGQNTGLAVFTNRVYGGEVTGCQYLGSAFSEEADFPETLAQWKIWLVYGIGMLSQFKARAETWLAGLGLSFPV